MVDMVFRSKGLSKDPLQKVAAVDSNQAPNRRTQEIQELLESLGHNPVEAMVQIANNPKASLELRGRMFAELAQYVAAKRKAVQFAAETEGSLQTNNKLVVEFVRAVPQVAPSDAPVRDVSRCPHSPTT